MNMCSLSTCTRKLKITAFKCRCELKFCTKHTFPEDHECTFIYKIFGNEDKMKIATESMKCVSDKVDKI